MQRGRNAETCAGFARIAQPVIVAIATAVVIASCAPARSTVDADGRVCPPGAEGTKSGCVCRADLRLLFGACVAPRVAEDHCGPSAIATADGCAPRPPCGLGRPRDLATGECLPLRDARAIATSFGVLVADDEVLECAGDRELAVGAPDGRGALGIGCVPPVTNGKLETCSAGSVREPSGTGCTRVIEGGAMRRDPRVDVVRWLQAVIGPEGAVAAPPLCEALARAPRSLAGGGIAGDAWGSASRLQLTVSASFRDNDVSLLIWSLRLRGSIALALPAVTVELSRALAPLMESLRALGGTATEAAIESSVSLKCARGGIEHVTRPAARLAP